MVDRPDSEMYIVIRIVAAVRKGALSTRANEHSEWQRVAGSGDEVGPEYDGNGAA